MRSPLLALFVCVNVMLVGCSSKSITEAAEGASPPALRQALIEAVIVDASPTLLLITSNNGEKIRRDELGRGLRSRQAKTL
jgi:hypothetical protein